MVKLPFLKDFDWKYFLLTIFLFGCSGSAYFFSANILQMLKGFFEIKDLNIFAGAIATIFTLTYKIKTRSFRFSPSMSFSEFRVPVEDILSFIGNPVTLVCAISLAKGLFLQTSEDIKYFPFFQTLELSFIAVVTSYLFFLSVMELLKNVNETLFKKSASRSIVTAIPEGQMTDAIPNPVNESNAMRL
jgi:hypothetical protein